MLFFIREVMTLLRLISYLPFKILYLFSDILFFLSFYIVRYRRKLVFQNLKNSFPNKSVKELKKIEREFYGNLCDYAMETIKLLTIRGEELRNRMLIQNVDLIRQFATEKQSVLFLASHQFNWEWALTSACFTFPIPIDFIYQPVESKIFEQFSLACRTRFGGYPIKRDDVAREMAKRRHIIRGVTSVADQYPGMSRDKKYFTTFLNQETVFFFGTNQLAILTQYPVLYLFIQKVKRGYYEGKLILIASPPFNNGEDTIIENYVRVVEKNIMENPSGWLWSHNRWKKRHLRQASTQYPPGSIVS